MLVVFIRTLVLYIMVVIAMRLMGKRQIGQLQPFELATAIMISELAAVPMQNTGIPLINGIIPIITLLILQLLFSVISLKSIRARAVICGKPSILVKNGRLDAQLMNKELYTVNDLLEQMRSKNTFSITDVEFAILETNGQLSIIPKSQKRPVNPADLSLSTKYEGLPAEIIIDGRLMHENLQKANLDTNWLFEIFKVNGGIMQKDILYASLDTNGELFIQLRNGNMKVINTSGN